ncbi:tripartite motif-containing protein 16-like protein [Chanos chanos]|uniref:Tripartite motif-containing protein 16-like protein n=1 Tax=Chanos chanos TaxID=29144 RepID=A0A6J2WMZ6_CHACN|nr:tripartite motif-containing protein 16-like protein [Chanos chanos]
MWKNMLANNQKDNSRQQTLTESFQRHGKPPADNAKGIREDREEEGQFDSSTVAMPSNSANPNAIMPQPKTPGKSHLQTPASAPATVTILIILIRFDSLKLPPYVPDIPEPTTRAELMKYWIPLSLDDRTAQKLLWLSEGGAKVSRMSEEVCPVLDRPERFEHSPQVLCKEGLLGQRGYWEVDYEGWVVIGAVCESVGRKAQDGPCGLGENDVSWGVGWAGSSYHAWHNSENTEIHAPFCPIMGVYLDQPAGIIKFFMVQSSEDGTKEVQLLHHYKTTVKERILPGFWVGRKSFCWIRKKDQ